MSTKTQQDRMYTQIFWKRMDKDERLVDLLWKIQY